MIAAVNDLPFRYQMISLEDALERLDRFMDLCKQTEKGEMTNISKIVIAQGYDYSGPLAPGYVLQKIVQRFPPDKKRYLMSVLTKRDILPKSDDTELFCLDGNTSYLCAAAKDDIVISLTSHPLFEEAKLNGMCGTSPQTIYNLSLKKHVDAHKERLGMRYYHANNKKHKPDRANNYGKGKIASPMDLDDTAAQQLLNKAIFINNRLYAKKNGKIYAFMKEGPCIYHGYIDNKAQEDIQRALNTIKWDENG